MPDTSEEKQDSNHVLSTTRHECSEKRYCRLARKKFISESSTNSCQVLELRVDLMSSEAILKNQDINFRDCFEWSFQSFLSLHDFRVQIWALKPLTKATDALEGRLFGRSESSCSSSYSSEFPKLKDENLDFSKLVSEQRDLIQRIDL